MPTYSQFDVVVVPFPYTDRATTKRRPALVLSDEANFNARVGQSVMAMVTSTQHSHWPLDVEITDLDSAGLPAPSLVRMKLFTLDHRLIIRRCGSLSEVDQASTQKALSRLLNWS